MIEQHEGLLLAALTSKAKSNRERNIAVEHCLVGIASLRKPNNAPRYLGMTSEIFGDNAGIGVRSRHADFEGFEGTHQHPQELGSSCVPIELRQLITASRGRHRR